MGGALSYGVWFNCREVVQPDIVPTRLSGPAALGADSIIAHLNGKPPYLNRILDFA
jgi:hypothetical protein